MRVRNIFRFAALSFVCWIIIPILIVSCSCAKSAQNNSYISEHKETIKDTSADVRSHIELGTFHDSIYVHDSTIVTIRGDTVTMTRWKTRYIERVKCKQVTDTIYRYIGQSRGEYDSESSWRQEKKTYNILSWLRYSLFFFLFILVLYILIAIKRRK